MSIDSKRLRGLAVRLALAAGVTLSAPLTVALWPSAAAGAQGSAVASAAAACECPTAGDTELLHRIADYADIGGGLHRRVNGVVKRYKALVRAIRARGGSEAEQIREVRSHTQEFVKQLRVAADRDLMDLEKVSKRWRAEARCDLTKSKVQQEIVADKKSIRSKEETDRAFPRLAVRAIRDHCGCSGFGPSTHTRRRSLAADRQPGRGPAVVDGHKAKPGEASSATSAASGVCGSPIGASIVADGNSFPGLDPLTGSGIAAGFGTVVVSGGPTVGCHYNPQDGPATPGNQQSTCYTNTIKPAGSVVTLTATPDANSTFKEWAYCPGGTGDPGAPLAGFCKTFDARSIRVFWPSVSGGSFAGSLVAYFTGDVYKLTVDNSAPAEGQINVNGGYGSTPSGDRIACGALGADSPQDTDCTAYEAYGSRVALTGEGLPGNGGQDTPDFESGCDTIAGPSAYANAATCELTMLADRTVTVSWTQAAGGVG